MMKAEIHRLAAILSKIEKSGVKKLTDLKIIKSRENCIYSHKRSEFIFFLFAIILSVSIWNYDLFLQGSCLIEFPSDVRARLFRRPESCDFCSSVSAIPYLKEISPEEFEEKYAYSAVPVIVTDATQNWTAPQTFDYWYFKSVYDNAKRKMKTLNCQFFPYKSGIKTLREAFKMEPERINYVAGTKPWYFGWSNCNPDVAKLLRQHYDRPYFLPKSSENAATDWIFMGGHGLGAHMHVDNVRLPSWQAQLKGRKQWILAPPPECYYQCSFFNVVVNQGDIIVLDTNKWFHQTNIVSGEISVTIGAEFD